MINIKTKSLLAYPFVVALILSMNTVYYRDYSNPRVGKVIITSVLFFAILLSLGSLFDMEKKGTTVKPLLGFVLKYLAITSVLFFVSSFRGGVSLNNVALILVFPLAICPFLYYEKSEDSIYIVTVYKNVVLILSGISLLFWGISLMGVTPQSAKMISWGPIHQVWGYYNLQFVPQGSVHFLWFTVIRNCSFFTEAPMFAFVLSLALLLHLFVEPNSKLFGGQSLLLMATIITTTSTTGVIIAILSVIVVISGKMTGFGKFILLFLLPVVAVIVFIIIQSKIQNMSGSVDARVDDLNAGFNAWKNAPFFGNGLKNTGIVKEYMDPSRVLTGGNSGFSSGFFRALAVGGIYYVFCWILGPAFSFARKNFNYRAFSVLFLMLFLVSLVDDTLLFYFVIVLMMMATI